MGCLRQAFNIVMLAYIGYAAPRAIGQVVEDIMDPREYPTEEMIQKRANELAASQNEKTAHYSSAASNAEKQLNQLKSRGIKP